MDNVQLPATILLYITGATTVTNILVNGVRTSVALPAVVSFLMAVILGVLFVALLMIANGVQMTIPLYAASIIAGVMVGGASAGSNAVHNKTLPTPNRVP